MRRSRATGLPVRPVAPPDAHGLGDGPRAPNRRTAAATDGGALVGQGGHRHPPPLADVADPVGVGDPHLGDVDLVELGLTGHLAQRAHLDAGRVHVQGEVGEALVLGRLGIGPGHQHAPVGDVGQGVPHLLPGDHPLVAVADGPGGQAGQVRAGPGLAEQLAPRLLAGERPAQHALAQLLGSVGDHRGAGHGQPEELPGPGRRGPRLAQAPVDLPLEIGGQVEPAVALGKRDPGQTEVELPGAELLHRGASRIDLLEELGDPIVDQRRLVCHTKNILAAISTELRWPLLWAEPWSGAPRRDGPGPRSRRSGLEAGHDPSAGPGLVAEPVVQAVLAVLPELVGLGRHPDPSPPRGPGDLTTGELAPPAR